jgi:hypothetical protein
VDNYVVQKIKKPDKANQNTKEITTIKVYDKINCDLLCKMCNDDRVNKEVNITEMTM